MPACLPCVTGSSFSTLVVFMLAVNGGVDQYGSLPVMITGTSGAPPAAGCTSVVAGELATQPAEVHLCPVPHICAGPTPLLCSVHSTCSVPLTSARS